MSTLYYPGEQSFFYLSGSRLDMKKINLHSLKTGLVSQFLSKTYNPWESCKYPSSTDIPNVEKQQVQVSFDIYKYSPKCSYTSVSRLQLLIIYSWPKVLLSHWSLFISGDSDIGSYKFFQNSTFGVVFFFRFLTLQQS